MNRTLENSQTGWIGIYRSITNHWIYPTGKFTKYEAWLDLLLIVNHSENKVFTGSDLILCKKGETVTSQKKLMDRWGWSKSKLLKFLDILKCDSMIDYKSDTKKTTIIILNYTDYQDFSSVEEIKKDHKKTEESPEKDIKKTTKGHQKDTNNNVNNVNNEKKYDYKNILLSEIQISELSENDKYYYQVAISFFKRFENNLNEANASTKNLYKAKGSWINHTRLLMTVDGYDQDKVKVIHEFLGKNRFWKRNILSISKLREKMDTLIMQSYGEDKQGNIKGAKADELAILLAKKFGAEG